LVICAGIIAAHMNAGLFGIAIAATTMLALAGMVVALDAVDPAVIDASASDTVLIILVLLLRMPLPLCYCYVIVLIK
jgi:hypothetical protein